MQPNALLIRQNFIVVKSGCSTAAARAIGWATDVEGFAALFASVLAVLKSNRIIRKRTDANCNSFHLRVFLWLSNPQGQRQTSTLSIPHDNFGERKAKFNLEMSRTTQM
jgi:hydroxyethylthiazole kinase-like sugar kinase family protein